MDSHRQIVNLGRVAKIIGYTLAFGTFGLALTFMAMAFGSY